MANSRSGESVAERIVRILDTFSAERTVQTAAQIARRADLSTSTAHRLIAELVGQGLLEKDDAGRIRVGMRLWELALRSSHALRLRQAALPHMQRIQALVREHTQLAVLEHGEALFLERLSSPTAVANITRIAGRLPLHASSSGLVLLAHASPTLIDHVLATPLPRLAGGTLTDRATLVATLERIRRDGHVVAPGSVEDVSTGIAVPIRARGTVVAALSMVLPRDARTTEPLALLRDAASRIGAELRPTD